MCRDAGIAVKMVTGDNLHTAKHIARECRLLRDDDALCLDGPTFRAMTDEQLLPLLPRLEVCPTSPPEMNNICGK
jgi:Ca2+-transporting ATPase